MDSGTEVYGTLVSDIQTDVEITGKVIKPNKVESPYISRDVPVEYCKYVELKKIIGGSIVWNQLIENGNFSSTDYWTTASGVTLSASDGILSLDGNTSTYFQLNLAVGHRPSSISGHKYLIALNIKCSSNKVYIIPTGAVSDGRFTPSNVLTDTRYNYIWNCSVDKQMYCTLRFLSTVEGTAEDIHAEVHDYMVIDLTAMLGSTIADYVSTLETAETGTGLAWLRSYGFLTENYYNYTAREIQSVCTNGRTSNGITYPISAIDLRGIISLDENNELKYDGDEYYANGTINRNYEYRAYESGDESLENAITDGTHTVVKLDTPIVELTIPYQETQKVGTTEYFEDYGVTTGERDVAIPVGNETDYLQNFAGEITGTLKYIEDGLAPSGYLSGSGNFIALHLEADDWNIYTSVLVGLDPSQGSGLVEILQDEEKIIVGKINSNEQVFKVVSTDGEFTKTDVYDLSGLVLETE